MKEAILNQVGAFPDRLINLAFRAESKIRNISRESYLEELEFYQKSLFRGDRKFLTLPQTPPRFSTLSSKPYWGGEEVLLQYPSRYQPRNPLVAPRFLAYSENRSGYLFLWRHSSDEAQARQRPLVLCVHGFRMGKPERAMAMFKVQKLFQMGMDVALFIQPHHWKRASSNFRQQFFNAEDVPLTLENVGQQIHDLHSCYLGLKAMGYARIGMIGGSLGGMAVTLYATLSDDPAFIFAVVPAIRVDVHLDPAKSKLPFRTDEILRTQTFRALDLIDPAFYSCKMDLKHVGVVYHKGDKINDARATEKWIDAWKLQNVTALSGGHWIVFDNKARGKAWYGWLRQHGFCR